MTPDDAPRTQRTERAGKPTGIWAAWTRFHKPTTTRRFLSLVAFYVGLLLCSVLLAVLGSPTERLIATAYIGAFAIFLVTIILEWFIVEPSRRQLINALELALKDPNSSEAWYACGEAHERLTKWD